MATSHEDANEPRSPRLRPSSLELTPSAVSSHLSAAWGSRPTAQRVARPRALREWRDFGPLEVLGVDRSWAGTLVPSARTYDLIRIHFLPFAVSAIALLLPGGSLKSPIWSVEPTVPRGADWGRCG